MRVATLIAVWLFALVHADTAHAHASLIGSEPADRAVIARPPEAIKLTFNEPVSPLVLRLVGEGGHALELSDVAAADATLTIRLPGPLPQGTHLLSWRVVSADGHPVGGTLTFSIGRPSVSAPDAPRFETRGWAIWAVRVALYVGLFLGIGGTFYAAWIARRPPAWPAGVLIAVARQAGLIAAILSIGLHGLDALALPGGALRELRVWYAGLTTAYGATAGVAALALVIAMIAGRAQPRPAQALSALALIGAGAALAASGHASSAVPQLLMRPMVFLHGVCVAFWVGALLPLWAAMRKGDASVAAELARFSRAILWPFAMLILSGGVLAAVQMRAVDALWTTAYGAILTGKLLAVLVLIALAAHNRRLTPAALTGDARAIQRLGRTVLIEIALVLAVLGLVAGWRFTPPPRAMIDAAAAPLQIHIHTERAMADMTIARNRSGGRQISMTMLDGQFGPLAAKEVTLVLSNRSAGIEPLRLRAQHIEATIWRIEDVRIPFPGRWQARVEILISDFEKVAIEDDIDLPR